MIRIVPRLISIIFLTVPIFVFVMIFRPKLRAKFMGYQLKNTKYMLDKMKNY